MNQEPMGCCPIEFERMRGALDHIAKTARASRSATRRIRWIAERAQRALDGQDFTQGDIELPKNSGPTAERLQRQVGHQRRINWHLRGLLLWVLWHHQGASSTIGQPLRRALGLDQFDHLTPEQVETAKAAAADIPEWLATEVKEGVPA